MKFSANTYEATVKNYFYHNKATIQQQAEKITFLFFLIL